MEHRSYGDGLWRYYRPGRAGSWVGRYQLNGERHEIGLGSCRNFTLSEARKRWRRKRQMVDDGIDPLLEKRRSRQPRSRTFRECAEAHLAANRAGWRGPNTARDWENSLINHVYSVLGDMAVSDIGTPDVLRVLEPLWQTKSQTAALLMQRLATILDWAKTRGYRTGENPARWDGHLATLLPAISKVAPKQHRAALPYREMPEFMAALRDADGTVARCLEFLILTTTRTKEARKAPWSEIDLPNRLWTLPPERMKSGREHRVPLSDAAMRLLNGLSAARPAAPDAPIFPSPRVPWPRPPKVFANAAMLDLLNRLMPGRKLTVHGFRSSFKDWTVEQTNFPSELAELQLAHTVGSSTEQAYRRSDMFERRRALVEAWARHCAGVSGDVVALPLVRAATLETASPSPIPALVEEPPMRVILRRPER